MNGHMVRKALGILAVSGYVAIGAPASAHHSMVAYEQGGAGATILEGVVTEVKWTNPHMMVFFDRKTPDGKTERWSAEGGAVTAAVNAGISPKLLKPGAQVKIRGSRHLDSTKHMMLLSTVEIGGVVYGRNTRADKSRY